MVVGATCSEVDPCWPIVQKPVTILADDGTKLGSISARGLVSYYARGAAVMWRKMDHMLTGSLLDVAWAVDPKSFFFTHVRDGKLIAVAPPARVTHESVIL
jgi:hypothetical protein